MRALSFKGAHGTPYGEWDLIIQSVESAFYFFVLSVAFVDNNRKFIN